MRRPLPTPQNLEGLAKAIARVRDRTESYADRYEENEERDHRLRRAWLLLAGAERVVQTELQSRKP